MSKPAELLLFEFLSEQIAAAERGSLLDERQCELHDTIYQTIKKPYGWRISEAESEFRPGPGGGLRELDAELTLVCFAKVEGTDKKQRQAALQKAYELQTAACQMFLDDHELGGRVCDIWVKRSGRGYDNYDSNPYAVVNMPLVINPTSYEE